MIQWSAIAASREVGVSSSLSINERIAWLFPQGELSDDSSLSDPVPEIKLSASGKIPLENVVAHYEQFSEVVQVKMPRVSDGETVYDDRDREVEGTKVSVSAFLRNVQQSLFDIGNKLEETFILSGNRPMVSSRKTSSASVPAQLINPSSHRLSITPSQLWTDVINAEAKSEAIQLLQFFDHNILDVDIILSSAERPTISVKHNTLKRVPFSILGDGLRRIFTLAGAVHGVRGGIMLVDELEMSIHTGALEKSFTWLFNTCVQNDIQLFVTTHSLEAVDKIIDVCDGEAFDLVAYRLKQEKEQTIMTRLDKGLLTRLREDLGLEVR
jgi:AAA15 family ATPase/GTPase